MSVEIHLLHPGALCPSKSSSTSIGYDIHSASRVEIPAGCRALVSTGIAIKFPSNLYATIRARFGYSLRGLDVIGGIINPENFSEIKILLANNSSENFCLNPGERIAQIIFFKQYNIALKVFRTRITSAK